VKTLTGTSIITRLEPYRVHLLVLLGAVGTMLMAFLAVTDRAVLLVGAVGGVAALVFTQRRPEAVLAMWIVVVPFVASAPNATFRRAFWLVHRLLPPLTILLILLAALGVGRNTSTKPLPRLRLTEVLMAGYLLASVLSVLYMNDNTTATLYRVYDRIFIPMCLYLLIVLLRPDEAALRKFVPFLIFATIAQVLLGAISWTVPGLLPSHWVTRAGERTVGSLGSPGEYTVLLTSGILLMAQSYSFRNRANGSGIRQALTRRSILAVILLGFVMVAFTFSRASWLAAALVAFGLLSLNPRVARNAAAGFVLIAILAVTSGVFAGQLDFAAQRLQSEGSTDTALSRLPVMAASVRMFQERPLQGWGFGNFDEVDRDFQTEVAGFFPQKDHVSHNVYLTIAAEQGAIGVVLFLGPLIGAAIITKRAWRSLAPRGFWSRKFVIALWLGLAVHVIVNNFADSQTTVGPGLWWATLGLIVSIGRSHFDIRETHGANS